MKKSILFLVDFNFTALHLYYFIQKKWSKIWQIKYFDYNIYVIMNVRVVHQPLYRDEWDLYQLENTYLLLSKFGYLY